MLVSLLLRLFPVEMTLLIVTTDRAGINKIAPHVSLTITACSMLHSMLHCMLTVVRKSEVSHDSRTSCPDLGLMRWPICHTEIVAVCACVLTWGRGEVWAIGPLSQLV